MHSMFNVNNITLNNSIINRIHVYVFSVVLYFGKYNSILHKCITNHVAKCKKYINLTETMPWKVGNTSRHKHRTLRGTLTPRRIWNEHTIEWNVYSTVPLNVEPIDQWDRNNVTLSNPVNGSHWYKPSSHSANRNPSQQFQSKYTFKLGSKIATCLTMDNVRNRLNTNNKVISGRAHALAWDGLI